MEALFHLLVDELTQATQAGERDCHGVAHRITQEVQRICTESQRIQVSGEVNAWAITLGKHRLSQCLKYYKLGSHRGRVELHSTLSAIVYRSIAPPQVQASYQARLTLIEDFLQGFYVEALKAFRRENQLSQRHQPRTRLELGEYMAFCERYGKRRIPLPRRRSQQLIILRAQTFSRQQPPETALDIEQSTESSGDGDSVRSPLTSNARLREQLVAHGDPLPEESLRDRVVEALMDYLKQNDQADCADYFTLRLMDLPTSEIESLLNLTPRERDYLQQRFRYHLIRFSLAHHWELVHEWLEADLGNNLGLTPQQWQTLEATLNPRQAQLLALKKAGKPNPDIAHTLGCTPIQVQKQWSKLLEQAWEIRNP